MSRSGIFNPDRFLPAIERVLLTLWVGSLWVSGFMVAPLLFATLDDRALAGTIAGKLFVITAWLGLACGAVLLASQFRCGAGWRVWVIAAMLVLVCIGQFALTPMIAELRATGMTGTPDFARLHGLASGLFVITAMLGLWLVAAGQGRGVSH